MLFAELQRQGSKARRVLLFPQHWSEDSDDSSGSKAADTASERQISTTRRLLRIAARRYNVVLRPLLLDSTEAQETNPQPDRDLLAMSHLTQYSQIISLLGPGLLLDSDPLDRLLSTPMPAKSTLQTIRPQEDSPSHEIPLFLLKPSRETFTALNSPPEINEQQQTPMLSHHKPMIPEHIDSDYFRTHILTTSDLPLHNVSLAVSTASYIHVSSSFSRSEPGPEYDIPSKIWSSMGPSRGERERRSVWEGIYERFRDTRMSVCGLDLEPWPKNQNL
ncbi:MAG: hypothetical protein M4579_002851 [Chaenotheca gracillima]|nr:MAG: hypothetical protein M4579_002851 [Chaenotheca gracillima]